MESIKKALCTPGFSFVEAISPCPTQFGRRNHYNSPAEMLKAEMERCITKEEAEFMDQETLEGKFVTGEYYHGKNQGN